jgi:hypothetical protein
VIEKGHFSQVSGTEADNETPTGKQPEFSRTYNLAELHEYIRYGLKKIFENEDSSITDDDIDSLLKVRMSGDNINATSRNQKKPRRHHNWKKLHMRWRRCQKQCTCSRV